MLESILIIVFDIILILLGVFLVSRYQVWFTRNRLKIISIFMVLGIGLYTIGYLTKSNGPMDYISSGLMAIFSTGRMFVFENDISSFETNVAHMPIYNTAFGIIMTFSMLTTAMIILSLLGYRVMSKLQLGFIKPFIYKRKVYLFTNLNENSLNLSNDIKKKNKNSIVILCVDGNNDSDEYRKLEKTAAQYRHIIYSVYNKKDIIRLSFQFRKSKLYLFAISEHVHDNISFISDYAAIINSKIEPTKFGSKNSNRLFHKGPNIKVSTYIFTDHDIYEDVFSRDEFSLLDLHIIDHNDLASRQLFHEFSLLESMRSGNTLTVCVIGFTEISENLYKNIVVLGQSDGVKLKLILVDEKIRDKTARFFHKNSEIKKCAEFEFIDAKPDTESYYEELKKRMGQISCIVIAIDKVNIVAEMCRLCIQSSSKTQICAYVKEYEKCKLLYETPLLKEVKCFGATAEVFTENIIVNEKLDQLAKQCHDYYNAIYNSTRPWEDISLFEKQSNRALALHIPSKLYSVGLKIIPGSDVEAYEELLRDEVIFERLAKGEHLRWNAYHFSNGWRTMVDIQNREKNKDEVLKLHSCLVDWEELDYVGSVYQRDYKKADRLLVQNIGKIVSTLGYGISKMSE